MTGDYTVEDMSDDRVTLMYKPVSLYTMIDVIEKITQQNNSALN